MRLVRDDTIYGTGKYAVINLQKLPVGSQITIIGPDGKDLSNLINFGKVGSGDEFFVVMLKDICAEAALLAYADYAKQYDAEYADSVTCMSMRSGQHSLFCKVPD